MSLSSFLLLFFFFLIVVVLTAQSDAQKCFYEAPFLDIYFRVSNPNIAQGQKEQKEGRKKKRHFLGRRLVSLLGGHLSDEF